MGNKLSKEAAFIKDLKLALRERGVRVKKKDLINFFIFIDQVCPWFIIDGAEIHPKKWRKVGRELNDILAKQGPEAVPANVFTYWSLIRVLVENTVDDPEKQQLLSVAEYCLCPLSREAMEGSLPTTNPPKATDGPKIPEATLYPQVSVGALPEQPTQPATPPPCQPATNQSSL